MKSIIMDFQNIRYLSDDEWRQPLFSITDLNLHEEKFNWNNLFSSTLNDSSRFRPR